MGTLCKCGCGELTSGLFKRGSKNFVEYVSGHNSIKENPFQGKKHSIKAKKKMKDKKIGYIPWNKDNFDTNTYYGVHQWVKRYFGKPKNCELCGSDIYVEWASRDHKYQAKREDWLRLCRKCHMEYDFINLGVRRRRREENYLCVL